MGVGRREAASGGRGGWCLCVCYFALGLAAAVVDVGCCEGDGALAGSPACDPVAVGDFVEGWGASRGVSQELGHGVILLAAHDFE